MDAVFHVITVAALAFFAYWLRLVKTGTEAAVKTTAEEAAKAAIRQLQWPAELARELQKSRGVERQELRFKGYGALWAKLRPLAIYDDTAINKTALRDLSASLSNWYFSESGGLLLTPQSRDFYFALQDLLRATSTAQGESDVERSFESEAGLRSAFASVLAAASTKEATAALDYFSAGSFDDWESKASDLGRMWRKGVNQVAPVWNTLDGKQRFATLQQVGSVLRTSLVNDLDSRLR